MTALSISLRNIKLGDKRIKGENEMRNYKVIAAFIPSAPKAFQDFLTFTLPNIDAVMVRVDWNQIEMSEGVYDFTIIDDAISQWNGRDKKIALIVSLVSDQVVGGGVNSATPAY